MLATSAQPLGASVAFLAGAALATTIGMTAAYRLGSSAAAFTTGARSDVVDYGIIVLLLILMVVVFRKRRDTRSPKWMSKLQRATLGQRANAILPRMRDWIGRNSWIVNEIVIGSSSS